MVFIYTLSYDHGGRGGLFTRITKEISEYVGRKYRNRADVKRSIDKIRIISLPLPETINTPSHLTFRKLNPLPQNGEFGRVILRDMYTRRLRIMRILFTIV